MALEDILSFKDSYLREKWVPFSPFEDIFASLHMTNNYSLGWRTPETSDRSCQVPMHFFMPPLPNCLNKPSALLRPRKHSAPVSRPFHLSHGTTTLGFIFQGGVIAAADTRASAGGLVACPAVHKITPIHSHLVVTSSGSGADCTLWERILIREIRLYELRHGRRLSIRGTAKLLSFMLHPFKGTEVCVALTLGPKLIYVCSDGARLQGNVFSIGSGSPYAYGVLDGGLRWRMSKEEAICLAREAVFRATHRDAYSGNNVDLFHVTAQGWKSGIKQKIKKKKYKSLMNRKLMFQTAE
uniref:Proteasome subunit beta n=1 Tax=Salarias fasciatus TaxID=181472 RepID=A0A672HMJ8_SALFA